MTLAKRGEVGFHGLGVRGAGGRYHIIGAGVGDEHNDDDIPHTHTHTLFMYDMYAVLHCARQITTTTTTTSFFDFDDT